jgi:hypothetical protein
MPNGSPAWCWSLVAGWRRRAVGTLKPTPWTLFAVGLMIATGAAVVTPWNEGGAR